MMGLSSFSGSAEEGLLELSPYKERGDIWEVEDKSSSSGTCWVDEQESTDWGDEIEQLEEAGESGWGSVFISLIGKGEAKIFPLDNINSE